MKMEGKSGKNTASTKKFSFPKRRNSKGKKESQGTPVDLETDSELHHSETVPLNEPSPLASGTCVEQGESPELKTDDENVVENQPTTKSSDSPSEGARKKKSKRKRLFRRSSKKESKGHDNSVNDGWEDKTRRSDSGLLSGEVCESSPINKATEVDSCENQENLPCEEAKNPGEVTDQSDGEGYVSTGEIGGVEAENLLEGKIENPSLGSGTADEANKGTKRKGFFKRGLSMKRMKSKNRAIKTESKAKNITTEPESLGEGQLANESKPTEEDDTRSTENVFDEVTSNKETASDEIVEKFPPKLVRKVSFVGPDGTKLESSDDGDSLTETIVGTGDELAVHTTAAEDPPSERTEKLPEMVVPKVVVVLEDTGCSETVAEVDDDDLTEVSSMSSSLLASSDAPDATSTSDVSRLFLTTDTDDTGSRITLEGISEESELEAKPELVLKESELESKSEIVEDKESQHNPESDKEESGSNSNLEVSETSENESVIEKLVANEAENKNGDWELVNKSCEMSIELSRVKKETLFNVKRLCCAVM